MEAQLPNSAEVDEFIVKHIDTVPHLEALLILRARRPDPMGPDQIAALLYIDSDSAAVILDNLVEKHLLAPVPDSGGKYHYDPETSLDLMIAKVEMTYRRELVRIANLIHSKASSGIRDFARAFRLTKERPQ